MNNSYNILIAQTRKRIAESKKLLDRYQAATEAYHKHNLEAQKWIREHKEATAKPGNSRLPLIEDRKE